MFYRLLGIAVWKGAKLLLRQRYGALYAPKPLVAGGALALVGGAVLALLRRNGSDD
jgi:hypothetical protein